MKAILLLFVVLISRFSIGQVHEQALLDSNYKGIPGLYKLNVIRLLSIPSEFHISLGFCGYSYILSPSNSYKKTSGCCKGDKLIESGSWRDNGSLLLLKSDDQHFVFGIFKYGIDYFLIQSINEDSFVSDLSNSIIKYGKLLKRKKIGKANYFINVTFPSKYYSGRLTKSGT